MLLNPQSARRLDCKDTRSRVPQSARSVIARKAPTARPIPAGPIAAIFRQPLNSGPTARAILAWAEGPGAITPHIRGLKARTILAWAEGPGAITPHIRGLKARAILAWAEGPGAITPHIRGLKARAKCPGPTTRLIPHELLIESDVILGKHRPHLRLEVAPLVMRGLRIDIPHQRHSIAQPNGERRIASLPAKPRKLRALGLDPLRRRNLQTLHDFRHRFVPCNKQRNVNVVGNSPNPNADVIRMIEGRSQDRMHLASNAIVQPRPALPGTEDKMHQHVRERLRHAHEYSAGLQPAFRFPLSFLGLRPRLIYPAPLALIQSNLFSER